MATRPASSGKGVAVQGLKLPFEVVFASSADDGYDARQLEAPSKAAAAPSQGQAGGDEPKPTHIKGWVSAKYCPYPQTLILRFPGGFFDLRKIQILSHQSKIAHTIELYAGASPSADPNEGDENTAVFTRLGYLSLDSNERSGFKARELKSVYVHARGNFLKLAIRKCHPNPLNQFNQVGIIAINVVGTRATGMPLPPPMQQQGQHEGAHHGYDGGAGGGGARAVIAQQMSQYHCDEKTAEKMVELERLKSLAIAQEDFDEAKRIKIHLDTLREVAGRLLQLERDKAAAVAREDYDTAKMIKKELDYLRGHAQNAGSQQHQQHHQQQQQQHYPPQRQPPQQHYGGGGGRGHAPPPADERPLGRNASQKQFPAQASGAPFPSSGHPHPHHQPPPQLREQHAADAYAAQHAYEQHHGGPAEYDEPEALEHHNVDPHAHHLSPHGSPEEEEAGLGAGAPPMQQQQQGFDDGRGGDERPIKPSRSSIAPAMDDEQPAIGGGGMGAGHRAQPKSSYDPPEDDAGITTNSGALPPPEALSAANRKDAEPLLDVFSEHAVLSLYSKDWRLRQSALKDMTQSLVSQDSGVGEKELFAAGCRVLRKGLGDKVSQVFLSAAQMMRVLLEEAAMKLRPEEVRLALEPLVVAMLDKLSSSQLRERDGGMQVLAFLALSPQVHPGLVVSSLLAPLKKKEKDSPLPLKCRAKLLTKAVLFYGPDDGYSLGLGVLAKFVQPHLLHRDAGVRDGMFNLIAALASLTGGGAKIMSLLKDLRPQTAETLQAKLDDVASGAMVFLRPAQPSLDEHYVSEHDATHTLNGVPVAGGGALAGVSAPTAAAAAPAAAAAAPKQHRPAAQAAPAAGRQQQHPPQQQQHPPAAQRQQAAAAAAKPAPAAPVIAEGEEDLSADLSGQCQFCGLADPSFTEEKLDLHYWSDCPILICCKQCEQVIEIPTLQEHLLQECEVAGAYRECPRCLQAVPAAQFDAHVARQDCAPPAPGMARCALCQADVHRSDEGWKQHLLVDTCPKNARPVK